MRWWEWLWETHWHGIPVGRWVIVILIFTAGYAVARLVARFLSHLLHLALGKAQANISAEDLHRLMRPAWLFPLFLLAAYGSAHILHFLNLSPKVVQWIQQVFQALTLLALALVGSRLLAVAQTILAAQYRQSGEPYKLQLVHPLFTIGRIILFLLVGFLILEHTLKLNVAPFFTTLGLGGLAVALAAQETLQHFISAIVIFSDRPFKLGDLIRLDANTTGTVEKIGLRSTHIRTLDNLLLVIPNKKLADSPLENLSQASERRLMFRLGLLYSTPTDVLERLIQELRLNLEKLPFLSRPPTVLFTNFQDSALEVTVIVFVQLDYKEAGADLPLTVLQLQERVAWVILRTVRAHEPYTGFAFPTRTLHIESFPRIGHAIQETTRYGQ
ncbi:MAG: mechanosensitive ion channel family protein [Bacteroidia bacterium]|nr:mechanosensitive ion channel family protein [Bacteroidia bacterium]MDW8089154.1 mechanosensitive ion channel family protein [Bacteroidia bacterium]